MPPLLRIALISEHASPLAAVGGVDAGGQNIYVAHVARALARRGHHVDVLTRRDSLDPRAAVDLRPGVRVLHIPAGPARFVPKERLLPHMDAFTRSCGRMFEASVAYDVIHANFFMSGLVALRLKAAFGVPMVMTFHALGLVRREHQGAADAFPAERIEIEQRIVDEADCLIAECPQDRNDLMRLYGANRARVSMVPCGVDLDEFAPGDKRSARRSLGLADDEFVVLQLGRLVPRKGIDNVVRALAKLDPAWRARLVVVGGETARPDASATPEIARLRDLAARLGIADRVTFTGHRQRADLRACYLAADVFVSTPWYEPFGITPLEAMACGTPVVGSAVGGIQYSVQHGTTGYLVPPHDPAALAERLALLHANPSLAEALGRAGVARVRSMFTWDKVAAELANTYHALRAPRSGRPGAARALRLVEQAGAGA